MRVSSLVVLMVLGLACFFSTGCSDDSTSLHVGMSHDEAITVLTSLDADDFTDQMSVATPDGSPINQSTLKERMWAIDGYQVTLETKFRDGKLAAIYYWDATIPVDRYIHLMEHRSLERIDFSGDGETYEIDVIEVIPAIP